MEEHMNFYCIIRNRVWVCSFNHFIFALLALQSCTFRVDFLHSFITFGVSSRLRLVSNFGDDDCRAGEIHTRAREISRRRDARVYFARPTIVIAKIRDFSSLTFIRPSVSLN